MKMCEVPGCVKPARSNVAELCPMHYHRQYRHGSIDTVSTGSNVTVSLGRRYRTIQAVGHPIAPPNGRAYEHRVALYDSIGPGSHPCHWCGKLVHWGPKGTVDNLEPDHLNGDGADNRIANLVPACRSCNVARAQQARSKAMRKAGWWSVNDTIEQGKTQHRRDPIT